MKHTGVVTWFNEIKGFGFIRDHVANDDVYVDFSAVQREGFRTLSAGEEVEFVRTETAGAPKAAEVRVIGGAS
ncbi:cold-shock DNA-binding domain protein [Alkalidesulfovibrio alkalitolerans DSM 16529]|uniref:Cold-shock DNA-binding domain protein n=1 Tax=Alkalidesulfovibrio alkalitolerans DSM 16529 TaxID=1121439 RepID=S7UEI3_9BACT|nr:cold shock domain-containing protein [Alkalidesulfovibrio alkalitolerans]EPR30653.1 cold-shock DNA-binding domain protein [Alkalidesulfovibrio alkalitolerans DSM 16529]